MWKNSICRYADDPHRCIKNVKFIGEGGYNKVYSATNICKPKRKPILAKRIMNKKNLPSVLEGIYCAKKLHHPNIVHTCKTYPEKNKLVSIQELVQGYNLEDYVDNQPGHRLDDPRRIASILYQYGKALNYLHTRHRLIHRDIKTENSIYNPQTGHLTVIDCDFAVKTPAQRRYGTTCFLAPEVEMCHVKTHKKQKTKCYYGTQADMWSLGMILFELIHGVNSSPVHNYNYLHDVYSGKKHPLQTVYKRNDIPEALYRILYRLLEVDPRKRMTAKQLIHHPWIKKTLRRID